ncbi:MAG: hypothetical protein ACP5GY_07860 [Vulcanisaeta sp.]
MIVNIVVYTSSSSSFSFDMSLVVPTRSDKPFIEVPGPSYSWSASFSYSQTQLDYGCGFYDSINMPNYPSTCSYNGGQYSTQLPAFGSNGGLITISIYGTEYILNYTEYECSYLWGIISLGCQAINYSYSTWFAPNSAPLCLSQPIYLMRPVNSTQVTSVSLTTHPKPYNLNKSHHNLVL